MDIEERDAAIERRDQAIDQLMDALHLVLLWNSTSPDTTLRQVRQIAQATIDDVQKMLTRNGVCGS